MQKQHAITTDDYLSVFSSYSERILRKPYILFFLSFLCKGSPIFNSATSCLLSFCSKDQNESLPLEKDFKVPNIEKVIEEGKKTPTKFRKIKLCRLESKLEPEMYTASGWPSVCGDALKTLAGKVSAEFDFTDEAQVLETKEGVTEDKEAAYGTAYAAFGGGLKGKEACHAIAALCEVCSIDSLISNFILPLQVILLPYFSSYICHLVFLWRNVLQKFKMW